MVFGHKIKDRETVLNTRGKRILWSQTIVGDDHDALSILGHSIAGSAMAFRRTHYVPPTVKVNDATLLSRQPGEAMNFTIDIATRPGNGKGFDGCISIQSMSESRSTDTSPIGGTRQYRHVGASLCFKAENSPNE